MCIIKDTYSCMQNYDISVCCYGDMGGSITHCALVRLVAFIFNDHYLDVNYLITIT